MFDVLERNREELIKEAEAHERAVDDGRTAALNIGEQVARWRKVHRSNEGAACL
jgi:hypothetical protein